MKELEQLESLALNPKLRQAGWDTYNAEPLNDRAVVAVRAFLAHGWTIVPTGEGGLQVERHDSGFDLEIEWKADGRLASIFAHAAHSNEDAAFVCLDFDALVKAEAGDA